MARRNPPAKWVLPATVNPSTKCLMVPVPNDPQHIAAFRGALLALASAYNWADDVAHTAKDVAAVWRGIVDNLNWGCEMSLLFRQPTQCLLEYSTDGGTTWNVAASFSACAHDEAQQLIADDLANGTLIGQSGINQLLNDGTLGHGGQFPPIPRPTEGTCRTLTFELPANGQWLCPIPLYAGDSIEVKSVSGGWSDGGGDWRCPDGSKYLFGACVGAYIYQGTDPLPATAHMRLIGFDGSAYHDMYNIKYTVPNTVLSFVLQCNDTPISNNLGSVTVTVEICTNSFTGDCFLAEALLYVMQTEQCSEGNTVKWHATGIGGSVQFNGGGLGWIICIDLRDANGHWPNKTGPWQVKVNCENNVSLGYLSARTYPPCQPGLGYIAGPYFNGQPVNPNTWYTVPADKPFFSIFSNALGNGQINSICIK